MNYCNHYNQAITVIIYIHLIYIIIDISLVITNITAVRSGLIMKAVQRGPDCSKERDKKYRKPAPFTGIVSKPEQFFSYCVLI
jgi:hypothetical protein